MTWAYYLLQVNIYLVIFYAFYQLLLDRETYFVLNRIYLITAGVLSLIIPFLKPEWFVRQAQTSHLRINIDQLNVMMTNVTISDEADQFNWGHLVAGIYICGVLFFICRFVIRLFAVQMLLKTKPEGMAFSFLRHKVIDSKLPGLDTINRHEEIHIRQLHTLDVLFYEMMAILVWCNPVIYLYKTTVKNIHEYLADEEAANYRGDKEAYALLLLSRAFGIDQNALTNTFYHKSLLKKRIFMLNKQRSRKTAVLKYGLFLPLFAVTLLLSSATIRKNEEIKAVAEKIASPLALGDLVKSITISASGKQTDSWSAFYQFVSRSVKYPAAAHEQKLQGNTLIKFTISKGEVNGLSVVTPLGLGCDAQVMKTILSFDDFKHIADGKYSLKVAFRIPAAHSPVANSTIHFPEGYVALKEVKVNAASSSSSLAVAGNKGGKVYDYVSLTKTPSFPGGIDAFYKYLAKNCNYPAQARENNIQGKVFLSFIIESNGQLSNIRVERRLGGGTDEEAIRLLKQSPRWTPGYSGNTPVRVKYNMPISFSLVAENGSSNDNLHSLIAEASDAETHARDRNYSNISVTAKTKTGEPVRVLLLRDKELPNDFLYTVDGKEINKEDLNNIDPGKIESMSIIKGASATALYGDKGKYGVAEIVLRKEKTISIIGKGESNN